MSELTIPPLHTRTLEETARALDMSVDTVRKTEIRALAKLRSNTIIRRLAKQAGLLRENEEAACVTN